MHQLANILRIGLYLALAIYLSTGEKAAAAETPSPRLLVHLLDYLAKDYGGAVENGAVTSESEYAEQIEFSKTALNEAHSLEIIASNKAIIEGTQRLNALILAKADANEVSALARDLQAQVIKVAGLVVAPTHWPDLSRGRELYQLNCTSCHGAQGFGDGPAGTALDPKPANFMDLEHMAEVSPFQAFNTIRIGVPGTGMPPFAHLSDAETWDLAFFALSLRYGSAKPDPAKVSFDESVLQQVATQSDQTLRASLAGSEEEKNAAIALWRLHSSSSSAADAANAFIAIANKHLQKALTAYGSQDMAAARTSALNAYLEGVEPIEPRLQANDPAATIRLEERMMAVRTAIDRQVSSEELEKIVQLATEELETAQGLLQDKSFSPYVIFITAAAIVFREGFEAVLLILALLGIIRAAGAPKAALWVHGGWLAAVACGGAAWLLSGYLLDISGASREMLEAVTSLFAVGVLLYVGFWLHRQTEISRWRAFLNDKVKALLKGRNLLGLAFLSFVAVFRESFETVLFLRAIWVESNEAGRAAMTGGVFASFTFLLVLAWVLLKSSARLPIRKLFMASAAVMGVLAITLAGKGIHSLQEAGNASITALPTSTRWDLIGFFPTWETAGAQLVVIFVLTIIWTIGSRPSPVSSR